jgi:hypothetical protein
MGKQLVNFITCGCESSAPFSDGENNVDIVLRHVLFLSLTHGEVSNDQYTSLFVLFCVLAIALSIVPLLTASGKKPEYPERTTDHGEATGQLYHLRLRVECTLFVIDKVGREPTPY